MSDFLLEVGTEEIPARMIRAAEADLERRFREWLSESGLDEGASVTVEATPRRLALFAQDLATRQPDREETLRGPAREIAFDEQGNPTPAALGFAAKAGMDVGDLEAGDDGRLVAQRTIAGRAASELLAEALPALIVGIRFPRGMYWTGRDGPRFIRPIRWLVALLDGAVVEFEIAGVASGNATWGHRRLGSGPLAVRAAEDYRAILEGNAVLLSPDERGRKILADAGSALPGGFSIRSNDRLLETLVYETEWPCAVAGEFDPGYLELPEEVLETVMLVHQKYFAVEDGSGTMAARFVAVANARDDISGTIRAGHERVLRARFNDARFFWQFDQRRSLADRVEELEAVTFQASLGSYAAKTDRNVEAAGRLAKDLELDPESADAALRAARLAKCDLTTEMVGEFPELQGKIGGLYATAQGELPAVAEAIYDHYLPVGAGGPVPRSAAGQVVSLADKLATLGGMFAIGLIPTGSKDPLALRRAAYGVIRIVVEAGLPLSLDQLVAVAEAGESAGSLREFLLERLRHWMQESGTAADVVQAVISASDQVPVDVLARGKALAAVRETPDFESLAVSFKRIRNILDEAGGVESFAGREADPALFEAGAETGLHEALGAVETKVAAGRDYEASLRETAVLRPALDKYFEDVLVMAEDEAVRANRLAFLAGLLRKLSTIADFAAIAPDRANG